MIKSAVIGCGRMGAFTSQSVVDYAPACWLPLSHAAAISKHDKLELVGLCDASDDNLERAQKHYGVGAGFSEYQDLAKTAKPELVGIATRTTGRVDIIECLAESGTKAFHVEKPLCNSMDELARMEAFFARDDVFVTYGAIRRFFAIYQHALSLVHSGDYGKLLEVRVNMGAGLLYWTHPHCIDLILFAAESRKVKSVQANFAEVEIGDHATDVVNDPVVKSASIWFEDGLVGHIGQAPGADLILSCERGEISVLNDGHEIHASKANGDNPYPQRQKLDVEFDDEKLSGTFAPISQLADCLNGDGAAIANNAIVKRDILIGQRISFGFAQSHLNGGGHVDIMGVDENMRIQARSGAFFA